MEAYFVSGHKEGNDWIFVPKPLEVEVCKLEKFGKNYRDIFKTKIDNLYCLKDMDVMMEGHTTYDVYSYFQITFYPCVNTTENNNKCKSPEEITAALGLSLVTVKIQDIELTPENYNSPTEVRGKELSSPAYLNLYQNIQAYFHIVHVETDIDVIGFELLKNIQTKTFFKYDGTFILPSINLNDLLHVPHQAYCQISIQLTEQILTLKRTNTKLTEVLGEVGGLMEVIFSLFRIISSFLTDNLYEQSLVNNLFSFDLDKKIITIKEKEKKKNNSETDEIKYNPLQISPKISQNILNIADDTTINTKNKLNNEGFNKNKLNNDKFLMSRTFKIPGKKKKYKMKASFSSNLAKFESNELKNKNLFLNRNINENNRFKENNINDIQNINENELNDRNETEQNLNKSRIVDKVKISKWSTCCCFLCARKFHNIQNILLDEGMKLIMDKLDIRFLFKKIIKDDKIQENYNLENMQIIMSEECKQKIIKLHNSIFGIT